MSKVYELQDDCMELELTLRKIAEMSNLLRNDLFIYDGDGIREDKELQNELIYSYKFAFMYMLILNDYVYKCSEQLKVMQNKIDELGEAQHGE